MSHTVVCMIEFENEADAQDLFDQVDARMDLAQVVGLGTEDGRTSYVRKVLDDGTLDQMLYKDRFGITRSGRYEPPPNNYPLWVDPGGDATKAYPSTDEAGDPTRVEHNGKEWENAYGDGNTWEPGKVGENIWQELGAV